MLITRKLHVNLDMVSWIPILNIFVLVVDVAKKPWWFVFLLLVPFVNLIVWFLVWASIAKQLNKSEGWGFLAVFPPTSIFVPAYFAFID
jgi:hypothetical protein